MISGRFLLLMLGAWHACAWAHTPAYPVKSVRIIVPYTPGGATDILARLLAAKFSEAMGQQFIAENRAGAAGLVGATLLGTGVIVGLLSGAPPLRRAMRQLMIGYGAAGITYLLGLLVGGGVG